MNFRRAMFRLVVVLLVVVSCLSHKKHALHKQHLKVDHSAKKFNILTHPSSEVFNQGLSLSNYDGDSHENVT